MAADPKKLGKDLIHAAGTGQVENMRSLLAENADPNVENMQGHTALIKAPLTVGSAPRSLLSPPGDAAQQ